MQVAVQVDTGQGKLDLTSTPMLCRVGFCTRGLWTELPGRLQICRTCNTAQSVMLLMSAAAAAALYHPEMCFGVAQPTGSAVGRQALSRLCIASILRSARLPKLGCLRALKPGSNVM